MYVKLFLKNLNPTSYSAYLTNSYIYRVTTVPRVRGERKCLTFVQTYYYKIANVEESYELFFIKINFISCY